MLNLNNMGFTTDLEGKIRNTNLPGSHFLMPLFEAVVNSIHAIEDKEEKNGRIEILIYRETPIVPLGQNSRAVPKITGIDIYDNGIGFNDDNLTSFMKSDSSYKKHRGGKGLGRFLWLKAFAEVQIESYFQNGNETCFRSFNFVPHGTGIENEKQETVEYHDSGTVVRLRNFGRKYADKSCGSNVIARQIAIHLFNEILRAECPTITLKDGDTVITVNDFVQELVSDSKSSEISINDYGFRVRHILLKDNKNEKHSINFCADNRVVLTRELRLPNLEDEIQAKGCSSIYKAFVSSEFLDTNTNNERTGFYISDEPDLIDELSWEQINTEIDNQAQIYLEPYMRETEETKKKLLESYLHSDGIEFAPLKDELDLEKIDIQTAKNPSALNLALYKKRQQLELKAREQSKELLEAVPKDNLEEYTRKIEALFLNCDKLSSSALAKYVCGRRVILDIFSKLLEKQDDGRRSLEKAIHNLIYAMGKDSETLNTGHNLWIIDEKLPFNSYVSSDKKFKSMDRKVAMDQSMEPDLAVFHNLYAYGENFPDSGAITFIEFKRPDRDDYTLLDNPIQQILDQVEQVEAGKALSDKGIRYKKNSRFYGYVICTITPSLEKIIKQRSELVHFPDEEGYFGFLKNQNLYIEIMDYQTLLKNAKKRNKVFFDKLNIPV